MSKQVWIRPMKDTPEEKKLLAEYLYANRKENRFDPELFQKNQVKVYVAYNDEGIQAFFPVRLSYTLESIATKPDLSPITHAKALVAMQTVLANKAAENNVADAMFVTYDEDVLKFAEHSGGWKKVIVPMLNLKFSELEGTPNGRN